MEVRHLKTFLSGTLPRTFEVLSAETTPGGIPFNHYKVVGPLKIG
jgi:hypothetical protein